MTQSQWSPHDHIREAETLLLRVHGEIDRELARKPSIITPRTRDDAVLFIRLALAHAQVAGAIVSAHVYDIALSDGGST